MNVSIEEPRRTRELSRLGGVGGNSRPATTQASELNIDWQEKKIHRDRWVGSANCGDDPRYSDDDEVLNASPRRALNSTIALAVTPMSHYPLG